MKMFGMRAKELENICKSLNALFFYELKNIMYIYICMYVY